MKDTAFREPTNGVIHTMNACLLFTVLHGKVCITRAKDVKGHVILPDTIEKMPVTDIGEGAFGHSYKLTGIDIPSSVVRIHKRAFIRCESLTLVVMPRSAVEVAQDAFEGCPKLGDALPPPPPPPPNNFGTFFETQYGKRPRRRACDYQLCRKINEGREASKVLAKCLEYDLSRQAALLAWQAHERA